MFPFYSVWDFFYTNTNIPTGQPLQLGQPLQKSSAFCIEALCFHQMNGSCNLKLAVVVPEIFTVFQSDGSSPLYINTVIGLAMPAGIENRIPSIYAQLFQAAGAMNKFPCGVSCPFFGTICQLRLLMRVSEGDIKAACLFP